MTCKDCIHERVCCALIEDGLPYMDEDHPAEAFCMTFKNKLDICDLVYGKWEFINQTTGYLEPPYGDTCKCSECGFIIDVSETYYKHCPKCGTRMTNGDNK